MFVTFFIPVLSYLTCLVVNVSDLYSVYVSVRPYNTIVFPLNINFNRLKRKLVPARALNAECVLLFALPHHIISILPRYWK